MQATAFDTPPWWQRVLPMFRGFDGPLLAAVLLLAGLGLTIMYSSGFDHGTRFVMHGRNMLLAAAIMFVVAQAPPQRLMRLAVPVYTAGVLLLVAVALFGITKKGAQRWLNVGVVIQPSEIMKIAVPLMLACWFQWRQGQGRSRAVDFAGAFALLAVPVALIMKQPVALALAGVAGIVVFGDELCADRVDWHVLREYQRQRVCTLLDPMRDPLGKGFHILQAMIAIGSGGLHGKGFMQGTQTHLEFIPERTTDFIFAAFSEEFGLAGNLLLIFGFWCLVLRALALSAVAPTLFSRLLAAAVSTIFFAYAFVNIGMVSGVLPVVGVPLPFISYGGTAMVTLGVALGILMSVSRARWLAEQQRKALLA